jgi:hypothetical protein|tara:strand:+ start:487 stop:792 length:306 start_codon:yes stop_codon:yes gene_type:complete
LSGKISGTAWTVKTGRVLVPTSDIGSYKVYMINDNLSNACSSSYSYTASNPLVYFSRDNLTVGETELGLGAGYGTCHTSLAVQPILLQREKSELTRTLLQQ